MLKYRLLIALVPSVLLLGCATTPTSDPADPAAAASGMSIRVVNEPTGDLAVTATPGLEVEAINKEGEPRVRVAWPRIPGADALNAHLAQDAQQAVTRFERAYDEGGVAVPSLNTSWALVMASGSVVGVRTSTDEFAGADEAWTFATIFGELGSREVWHGQDLIEPAKRSALAEAIAQRVGAKGGPGESDPNAVLAASVPTAGGGLRLVLPGGILGPHSDPLREVTLTPAAARPYLSQAGRRLSAAVGRPYAAANDPSSTTPGKDAAQPRTPSGAVDCTRVSCVALTFDDGPGPSTSAVLDELAKENVKATFFQLGSNLAAYPKVEARMKAEGHVVANHTWDHKDLTKLSADEATEDLSRTSKAIEKAVGARPTLMRPPYGAISPSTPVEGMSVIMWDIDTQDWKNRDSEETTKRALEAKRGSIILMHDIRPSTAKALPGILAGLRAKGLTPVTVPELLGKSEPGKRYFRGK